MVGNAGGKISLLCYRRVYSGRFALSTGKKCMGVSCMDYDSVCGVISVLCVGVYCDWLKRQFLYLIYNHTFRNSLGSGGSFNEYVSFRPHGAFYNLHHSSAYMDSIFNVFRHKPFQGELTDQYGHYALFFYLPLKIFGCNSASIAVALGVLSVATYIFCMLSFGMAVKSNIIRIVTVVVAGIVGLNPILGSIYWQCYPQRLIFPAITIFMITFLEKKGIKKDGIFWELS